MLAIRNMQTSKEHLTTIVRAFFFFGGGMGGRGGKQSQLCGIGKLTKTKLQWSRLSHIQTWKLGVHELNIQIVMQKESSERKEDFFQGKFIGYACFIGIGKAWATLLNWNLRFRRNNGETRLTQLFMNKTEGIQRVSMGFTDNWQMAKILTDNWQTA